MNRTKFSILATAVTLCVSMQASATVFGSDSHDTYNQPTAGAAAGAVAGAVGVGVGIGQGGAGGAGGQGGEGGRGGAGGIGMGGAGGSVLGSGNSANANTNTNANLQGQQQGQGQSQSSRNDNRSSATGGAGGSSLSQSAGGQATGGAAVGGGAVSGSTAAGGNGAGNVTTVDASSEYKAAASTAYAPDGKAPRTSCRLFIGIGGSQTGGSLSGGIPIANDQTCMSGAQIEAMDKANKVAPNTFQIGDYLLAICKMEGMDQMSGCKAAQ